MVHSEREGQSDHEHGRAAVVLRQASHNNGAFGAASCPSSGEHGFRNRMSDAPCGLSAISSRAPPVHSLHDVARLAEEMKENFFVENLVKDRKWHFKTYKRCFLHEDGLRWLTDRVLKLEDENGEGPATSMCSSFAEMERYLDEVKIKAALLGNLMIKAGFIAHVCNDHLFDVNHSTRTLFFRFHISSSTVARLTGAPSLPPRPSESSRSRSMAITPPRSNTSRGFAHIVEQHNSDPPRSVGKSHEALPNAVPISSSKDDREVVPLVGDHSVHEVNANPVSDEVSVMTMLTRISNASSDESTKNLMCDGNRNRHVDISILSLARDFHSNFLLMRKIKDRTYHLKRYKSCFLHDDAMSWLSRQVRFHYHAARQSMQAQADEGSALLSFEESEIVAAKLGNAMIHHGYITHVCGHHILRPGMRLKLFFKFRTRRMERDYKSCSLGRYSEVEIAKVQRELFVRESYQMIEKPGATAKRKSGTIHRAEQVNCES